MEDQLCRGPPHGAGLTSMELWCLLSPPLECVTFEYGALVWSETVHQVHWLWGLPRGESQGQLPPVFCLGPLSMRDQVICRWLQLVVGLEVPRRGQAPNQGQLLLVLVLGQLTERDGAP